MGFSDAQIDNGKSFMIDGEPIYHNLDTDKIESGLDKIGSIAKDTSSILSSIFPKKTPATPTTPTTTTKTPATPTVTPISGSTNTPENNTILYVVIGVGILGAIGTAIYFIAKK